MGLSIRGVFLHHGSGQKNMGWRLVRIQICRVVASPKDTGVHRYRTPASGVKELWSQCGGSMGLIHSEFVRIAAHIYFLKKGHY